MLQRILRRQCSRSLRQLMHDLDPSTVLRSFGLTQFRVSQSTFDRSFDTVWNPCTPTRWFSSGKFQSNKTSSNTTLLHRLLPRAIIPGVELMRLHKFSATWLLAWPCFWSTALAAAPGSMPDLYLIGLFGTGSIVMRSAGCIVNDMWDTDLDRKVERTKYRPLAAKTLSLTQGMGLLSVHGALGLLVLFQLNDYSKIVALCSVPFACSYPLLKRITYWPQLWLGATINWGALIGWAAVWGSNEWNVVLPLYTSGIFWTLIYDTIYACQDKKDDQIAGVKSTALFFGENIKYWLTGFAGCQVTGLILTGIAADCGLMYYYSVLATAGHLTWQIASVNVNCPFDCMKKFVSNIWLGAILFLGISSDKLLSI